jgi:hypothetical protein
MRIKSADAIALLALPLLVAAFLAGGAVWPTVCLMLAGAIVVFVVAGHEDLAWKQRVAICTAVFTVDMAMMVYLYRVNVANALRAQIAPLVAATLPSPVSSNCPIARGEVGLYLGNSVSVITKFPHVVFRVRGEDVLVIERQEAGLLISFTGFDASGNVVLRLERNALQTRLGGAHVERPSAGELVLLDDRDSKVLDVQFLNPQAIKVTGILRYPGVEPIVITEKYLGRGGAIAPPACSTGPEAEFVFP